MFKRFGGWVVFCGVWMAVTSGGFRAEAATYSNADPALFIADPFVLRHDGMYYLYGTNTGTGFKVYTSRDLVHWSQPAGVDDGFCLLAENSWGRGGFWAPEVIFQKGRFLMHYTVEEHIAVAESDSPLGPFVQTEKKPLHADTKEIDPHVFIDDDGRAYLFMVRFHQGNEIWAAEMDPSLKSLKEETLCRCIRQSQDWEKSTDHPLACNEGPLVIKHKGWYYLMYSANHFQSRDYGVGYAVARCPLGPWRKYAGNPVLQSNDQVHGAGHHCLTKSPDETEWWMVYHTHFNLNKVSPRKLALDRMYFEPTSTGGPDVIKVIGPTLSPQPMPSGGPASAESGSQSFGSGLLKREKTHQAGDQIFDKYTLLCLRA